MARQSMLPRGCSCIKSPWVREFLTLLRWSSDELGSWFITWWWMLTIDVRATNLVNLCISGSGLPILSLPITCCSLRQTLVGWRSSSTSRSGSQTDLRTNVGPWSSPHNWWSCQTLASLQLSWKDINCPFHDLLIVDWIGIHYPLDWISTYGLCLSDPPRVPSSGQASNFEWKFQPMIGDIHWG